LVQRALSLEQVVRRDRLVAAAALSILAGLAWLWLLRMDPGMAMPGMTMPAGHARPARDVLLLFLMWTVMMTAMMLPSAAPMILLVAGVDRRRRESGHPAVPTAVFAAGYLLVWTTFSLVAALAQWNLHRAALLSPAMASTSPVLGGLLLVAAGVYQWLPLKSVCLHHCRSPLHFLGAHWREGTAGALAMGARHGLYCLGCCWALMGLLFVVGVMNLLWVAAIAGLVLVEKVAAAGPWVGRLAGVAMIGGGVWMLASM
jgi:predicted metal-binding membrane protein